MRLAAFKKYEDDPVPKYLSAQVGLEAHCFANSRAMFRKSPTSSTISIAVVMIFFAVITWRWSWNEGPSIIRSDVEGYYGYLRAIFINQDLGHEKPNWVFLHQTPEGTLNKYFAGEAVMLLPFFLVAHAVAHLTGEIPNGLSPPYGHAIGLAALCYAFFGLLAFRSLLRRLGISEPVMATTLLVLGFGTQLVQYTSLQPGWSHVYSFSAVSVFLLFTQRFSGVVRSRDLLVWGAVFGLIVLIRPVNGLVILALPIVWGKDLPAVFRSVLKDRLGMIAAVGAFSAVISIQSMLWYAQVGHFVADGYKDEGFYWSRPAFFQVLFGIRRGLFVWAPALLLPAVAVIALWRSDRWRAIGGLVYWLANTYVIACWWIWYYGSGWGQRVYIEHYPVLLLPMAFALQRWAGWRHKLAMAFLLLASLLTLAQFYQYNHRILHVESMDRKKYAFTFLRFGAEYQDRLGGNFRMPPYSPNGLDTLLHEKWDMEASAPHWHGNAELSATAFSPGHVAICGVDDEFGPGFETNLNELPAGRALFLAIGFERRVQAKDDSRTVLCVVTAEQPPAIPAFYEPFFMDPVPPAAGEWEHIEYRIAIPPLSAGERIKFYFWNQQGAGRFEVDDLDATLMVVKPY